MLDRAAVDHLEGDGLLLGCGGPRLWVRPTCFHCTSLLDSCLVCVLLLSANNSRTPVLQNAGSKTMVFPSVLGASTRFSLD